MLANTSDAVRARLIPVLQKLSLPTSYSGDINGALEFISHDKKCIGSTVSVITVDEVGKFKCKKMELDEFSSLVKKVFDN